MRKVLSFAILICFGGAGLLAMSEYPYLPLSFAMMLIPFSALFLVGCLFRNNRTEDVSGPPPTLPPLTRSRSPRARAPFQLS